MPIRLRDASAFVARLIATTGDATSALAGTHVGPPAVAGALVTRLGDVISELAGSYQAASNSFGTIAVTLQGVTTSEFGTALPPPIPNRTGTVATTLAGMSCAATGTRTVPQQVTSYWPNWPMMHWICVQGNNLLDSTEWDLFADHDGVTFQSINPTLARIQSRSAAIAGIKAQQAATIDTKFFMYLTPTETWKVTPSPGNNEKDINRALIDDPVKGNPNWIVHRVGQTGDSGRCEAEFSPSTYHQVNVAIGAGVNSLGETYAQAYWKEWDSILHIGADDLRPHIAGIFHDVFCQRPAPITQNNGATNVTDPDYDANGVADVMNNFSAAANAGGRKWQEGELDMVAQFESRFPGKHISENAATWDEDYIDGGGAPTLPLSNGLYYRKCKLPLNEISNFKLGLRIAPSGTNYNTTGGGSISSYFRSYEIYERYLKLDANMPASIGKAAVLQHCSGIDRAPVADDYDFMRFCLLINLLVERAAPCGQMSGRRAFTLDEMLLELGTPTVTRTMGTLNESTLAFSLRAPDRTVGAATFHWAVFQKGIVIARTDAPTVGTWPSADAAVTCTLPTPAAGKKWQRINSASYVNPITGRAMRGQNTALNNGADATSVSLKPWHAMALRLVNA